MQFLINHLYILLTVVFAVSSQLIIKWQMSKFSLEDSMNLYEKFIFALSMLLNPYIVLSIMLTLLSGLSWMIAMTKFDISYAYPYTALGFVLILLFSYIFFHETISLHKIIGVSLIMFGIFVVSKDM